MKMTNAWSLRRTILWCCGLDIIVSVLFGGVYFAFGFGGLLPLMGWIGAYKYESGLVLWYGLYNALAIVLRVIVFVYYDKDENNVADIGGIAELWIAVATFLTIIIEVWIMSMVLKFRGVLLSLDYNRLMNLRSGWVPVMPRIVLTP